MKIQTHQKTIRTSIAGFTVAFCCLFAAVQSQAGAVLKLYYDPIPGLAVSDLTSASSFPDAPVDRTVTVDLLENPANFGNDYGTWTRGYIEAPQTGQYTFWVASDDDAEFWLSTSFATNSLVKICENVGAVGPRVFNAKPAQQSALINLVRGEKYYFELLHKEGGGGDHVAVGWQLPDGTMERPISGVRLIPFPVNEVAFNVFEPRDTAPLFLTDYLGAIVPTLADTFVEEGRSLILAPTIEATQPVVFQWYRNGVLLPGENLLTYSITNAAFGTDAQYTLVASNALGVTTNSAMVNVLQDLTPPTLTSAIKRGNTRVTVIFSEALDPATATVSANYTLDNGATVTSAEIGDRENVVLLTTSSLTVGTAYNLFVSNVGDQAATPNPIAPGSTILLDSGLKLWMKLDETAGTTAADSSGNGINATLAGSPKHNLSGKVVGAMGFDGIDDHGVWPDGFNDFTGGITIALWANPAAVGNWARFVEFGNGPAADNIIFAREAESQNLHLGIPGGFLNGSGAIENGVWQHLAATVDGSGMATLFKNGIPIATGPVPLPNGTVRTRNYFGRSNWPLPDAHYSGKMDDIRVYTRALDAAEIAALASDDPAVSSVTIVATDAQAGEEAANPGVFTITRSGNTSSPLTVSYFIEGSAINGTDYATLAASVIIPAGTNAVTITVVPVDDAILDQSETIILRLAGSADYIGGASENATVIIVDNEDSVPPQLVVATVDSAINLWFNEPVSSATANNPANYTLNGSAATITTVALTPNGHGVVLGVSAPVTESSVTITVANVQDVGGNTMTEATVAVNALLSVPLNLVANNYNSPSSRSADFQIATDGIVNNGNNDGGFDTFGFPTELSDFVGLIYPNTQVIEAIKVDLGNQFSDGGSWETQPKVYRLKTNVDTDRIFPHVDSQNWEEVPAQLVSGSLFDQLVDPSPSPNSPIVFSLKNLPLEQRTGFGWAVGGVRGDGFFAFLSITELRAYGTAGTNRAITIVTQPEAVSITENESATFSVTVTGTPAFSYQWQVNEGDIPGATASSYTIPVAQLFDNASVYRVVVSNVVGAVTSSNALLTVTADTHAASVIAATYESNINVWFSEAVASGSADNAANYTLSDAGTSITGATLDAYNRRVVLTLSGPLAPNSTLTVSNVLDSFGNNLTNQTIGIQSRLAAINVVGNNYNSAIPGGRPGAFAMSTDLIVDHFDNGLGWDTASGQAAEYSDFVGLLYSEPSIFNVIKVDLGNQFIDGGSWAVQPKVYLLTNNVDTDAFAPELGLGYWTEVDARLISGSTFDLAIDTQPGNAPPNSPVAFDLSQLPENQRTGFGWAVGGARGDGTVAFLSITELGSYGTAASVPVIPSLTIAVSSGNLVISWPAAATDYVLETKEHLSSALNWLPVDTAQQVNGDQKTVTIPIGTTSAFYRLRN